jgi:hypothetical protein
MVPGGLGSPRARALHSTQEDPMFVLQSSISRLAALAAFSLAAACGSPDQANELDVAHASAAVQSGQASDTIVAGLMAVNYPTIVGMGQGGELPQQKLAELKSALGGGQSALPCDVEVERAGRQSYRVTFNQCVLGEAGLITIDGSILVTYDVIVLQRQVALTLTFEKFMINSKQVNGTINANASLNVLQQVTTIKLTTPKPLSLSDQNGQSGQMNIELVTVQLTEKAAHAEFDGKVTITSNDGKKTYQIELKDVLVDAGDGAPHAGTVTVVYTKVRKIGNQEIATTHTLKITFTEETPQDGSFELELDGVPLGRYTWEQLKDLLEQL